MKRFVSLFIAVVLLNGCSDDDTAGRVPRITGKWKLVQYVSYNTAENTPDTTAYPEDNVIYDFRIDKVLSVNKDNAGYHKGEYSYKLESGHLSGSPSEKAPEEYVMTIENTKWAFDRFSDTIRLSQAYVDGGVLFLVEHN
ncbi:hypothetical protein LS482_00705 [Sinomicrobium kalidii]|uniref:hypothetical protein n=1 Tax=Sinomicrobium kalidii TaxID=2900738 RepID=UPI001E5EA4C5|nr:hypothetical protein [Sinomicrobium kalidii]UGU16403.1 hypothetical protein LS482_00705 [Sinomicrobium kalidii]